MKMNPELSLTKARKLVDGSQRMLISHTHRVIQLRILVARLEERLVSYDDIVQWICCPTTRRVHDLESLQTVEEYSSPLDELWVASRLHLLGYDPRISDPPSSSMQTDYLMEVLAHYQLVARNPSSMDGAGPRAHTILERN
jgi:hypothetical protein